jgi:fucose permease
MVLFFLYVGSEASLGTWAYTLLVESRGISPKVAGLWAGSYWASFTVGRAMAGLYAKRVGVATLVRVSLIAALVGAVLMWWNPAAWTNAMAVALIGLAIAPVFPALMSGTSQLVGVHFAANTIGMQMAAGALGAAVIPSVVGILARRSSLEVVPVCLVVLFAGLLGLSAVAARSVNSRGESNQLA